MIVDANIIRELFQSIQGFRNEVNKAGGDVKQTPVSIENMRIVASKLLDIEIKSELVSFEAEHLYSQVERSEGSALISIRADLSEEMRRAAFVKELCHLLFDPRDSWSTDVVGTVSALVEHRALEVADGSAHVQPKNQTVFVEEIASVSSTELLYPYELRSGHRSKLDNLSVSYRKLAMDMKLPLWMANWPFAKWYLKLEELRPTPETCKWKSCQ